MDQTPIFFDNSSKYTINEKGKREIIMKKSTGTKERCTFMLTVSSDGVKFPPYIIFKSNNKKPILNPFQEYTILTHNKKGKIYTLIKNYAVLINSFERLGN